MKPENIKADDLITAPKIARKTGHHRVSVYDAIKRLGITPKLVVGSISYYHTEIVSKLEKNMRTPRSGGAQ